jgi:hypothetical protein
MKTLHSFLLGGGRRPRRVVHEQLEFPLSGAKLTRAEAEGLAELRRLREALSARRT